VTLLAWLAVGAIFAASLTLDPAYSVNGLYVGPVLLAMWAPHARLPYQIAAASTAAVTLNTVLLPLPPLPVAAVVFNRLLTMATFWLTAFVASRFRHSERGRLVDQSARAEAEDALRRSVKDLEDIKYALDQSAIVASTDVQGTITYANDKFCEISGYSRQELIGRNHRILNSGLHPIEFFREMYRTIGAGRVWRGEIRNRSKQGQYYWVDTTIVPLLDDRGHPVQYVAIRYDITERKRSEAAMREQTALAQVGKMAAVVAHEVRNPLAGIRGGVQLLGSLLPDGGEGRDLIGDIVTRIDSLNAVLSDLLVFARMRAPRRSDVDVAAFLSDLGAWMALDPSMRGVRLQVSGHPDRTIDADPDQLRLVFSNLLLNAAQAMNNDGTIDVVVEDDDTGGVVLTVSDRGPGIPIELRERVFEPFFTTRHRGTGLGLPTARRVVEAHGGSIAMIDAPGGGAAVRIHLPRPPA
jgi:PAS domain S-box-containing protein